MVDLLINTVFYWHCCWQLQLAVCSRLQRNKTVYAYVYGGINMNSTFSYEHLNIRPVHLLGPN